MSRASRHHTTIQREAHWQRQVAALLKDNAALKQMLAQLQTQTQSQVASLQSQLQSQQQQIEQLRKQTNPLKPNRHKKERKPRAARDPQHNHARQRAEVAPDQVIGHQISNCPDCGMELHRQQLSHRHQVIDIAPPPPGIVSEHQVYRGYCYGCERWYSAQPQLAGAVVGKARFGPHLTAWVGWLRSSLRLPVRKIKQYLQAAYGLTVSVGGINQLLERLVAQGADELAATKERIKSRAVIHMDETGWREDGVQGYVWGMFTPQGERYYERGSRASGEAKRLLDGFSGIVVSDFYAGYNIYSGRHQRCWVHLLRLLAKVAERNEGNREVGGWIAQLQELYVQGNQVAQRGASSAEREQAAQQLQEQAVVLGQQYARCKQHPLKASCQLVLRHQGELFEYVREAGLAADNNLAERSIRPLAVARKISGGTRSPTGSKVRMGLQSLFSTWEAQGQEPLEACLTMLGAKSKTRVPQL